MTKSASKMRGELRVRAPQAVRERAALEALSIRTVDVLDVEALRLVPADEAARELVRIARGIAEHLDRQQMSWVVELSGGSNEACNDRALVEHRELDHHAGELIAAQLRRMLEPSAAAAPIEGHEDVAVQTGEGQQQKRNAVDSEYSSWKHVL